MAISAATSSVDRIVLSQSNNSKSLFNSGKAGVSSSISWQQGDLVCYDTSTFLLRVVAATSDAANIVGIADNRILNGQLYSPYAGLTNVDAAQVSPDFVGPKYSVVAQMKLHTGDTLVFGQKVYLVDGADTQTVGATDPGDHNYVGIYMGSGITSAPAGSQVQVLIIARYPALDIG